MLKDLNDLRNRARPFMDYNAQIRRDSYKYYEILNSLIFAQRAGLSLSPQPRLLHHHPSLGEGLYKSFA